MRYVGVRAVPHGWLRDRVEFLYVMDDIRHYFNLFYILFDLSPFRCLVDCSLFLFKFSPCPCTTLGGVLFL